MAVSTTGAVVLFLAGAAKLAAPEEIHATLRALGVNDPTRTAAVLAVMEVVAGALLILWPASFATAVVVVSLASAFAAAGVFALVKRISVHCACLGPTFAGRLGGHQLALLPVWIVVAFVSLDPSPLTLDERAVLLVIVLVVLNVAALTRVSPLAREHREQRYALGDR